MTERALSDLVVLELSTGGAGPYCGKLLADLGALVVKVEPPGGDPVRQEPPLVDGESAYFNWLNAGKLSVDEPGLEALAARAGIIVHSERGAAADRLEERLLALNPAAVVVSLTPYGRSGERSGWEASAFTEYATGGYHYFGGDPAREPLALPGHQVEFHSGLQAAIAGLAGLWHARETGRGQRVEISHQECMLSAHAWLTTMWTHAGQVQRRTGSLYAKCADGYIFLFNLVPYPNLFILMERFDLMEDESLLDPLTWMARFNEAVFPAFAEWAATRTKEEIYHAAQELRIAMTPVNTMADLAASTQLAARDWSIETEVGGKKLQAPGFPYKLGATPCQVASRAPKFGEHTQQVLSPDFAWPAAPPVERTASPTGGACGPLSGLRVIEVTANWAGPIGGRHLADLGAEVIKIELASKPATRALAWVAADNTWPRHYERSGYFNKLNRNKKDVCLDLSKPEGKEIFLQLVARSDVVIENNAARVMSQLGLAYDTLGQVNPRLVMCSMSGFGATGPERNYSAYGSNIETVCGLASLLGYGPGEFFGTGSYYADPVTGNHGAVAILAALHARRRTGRGQWIDMALLEAAVPFFAQQFLEYSATGKSPEPMANRHPQFCPQDVYPTAGADCWLALTVRHDSDWRALCDVMGREDLRSDAILATAQGRRARRAEVDGAIREWASTRDHIAAAKELQAVGVPAAPVMPNWEIFTDNHLNERGFFVRIGHAEAGTHWWPGFPWRFEATPAAIYRAAPLFAEHNREVFCGLLGLSEQHLAKLYECGVTFDEPQYAGGPGL